MPLDEATLKNLELLSTLRDQEREGSRVQRQGEKDHPAKLPGQSEEGHSRPESGCSRVRLLLPSRELSERVQSADAVDQEAPASQTALPVETSQTASPQAQAVGVSG